jgi:hypothetical protein
MRRNSRFFPLIVFILLPMLGYSQELLQGEWRDHLSYRTCYRIAEMNDLIYCSAESGLISFDKNTHELRKHSKTTGLSDVQIKTIAYSSEAKCLIIGYSNGNIDLLYEGETPVNISDIKRRIMTANKSINKIYVNGQIAYLACGFGIVVLNLEKQEIKETYILGESGSYLKVNDIAILNNELYAATESGIFTANLSSPNLLDFAYWTRLDFIPHFTSEFKAVEVYNDKLFLAYSDLNTLHDEIITISSESNTFQEWSKEYDTVVNDIASCNGFLTISSQSRAMIYDNNEELADDFVSYNTQHIYVSSNNQIFVASTYDGFLWYEDGKVHKYLTINGPRFSEVSKVSTLADRVWVSSGGPSRPYKHGAAHYLNSSGEWKSLTGSDIHTEKPLGNTYKIAIDPGNPEHVFAASYGYGIFEFRNNLVDKIYELNNTDLFSDIPEIIGIRASGIQFDTQSNLYFIIDLVSNPLFIIDADGNWQRPEINNSLFSKQNIVYSDLLVTSRGQIWLLSRTSGIIILENDGNGSYRSKNIIIKNQFDNVLSRAYCLEEDKDGNIWVGTNNGPIIYYSPWDIFDISDVSGTQVIIPRNDGTNIVDPLLFSESIFDIAIDGGNRKWLATDQSGVFLISDDGKKTLANFKAENSPLFSNGVTGIGINEKTGEVFFATDLGLVSYGGTAIEGLSDYSEVFVYPNPIKPGYDGPITITGLVANSIVKITDVSGNLVWETNSLGGNAIWDGKNFRGRQVSTGVYLVMVATDDGSQSHIIKLLFLH